MVDATTSRSDLVLVFHRLSSRLRAAREDRKFRWTHWPTALPSFLVTYSIASLLVKYNLNIDVSVSWAKLNDDAEHCQLLHEYRSIYLVKIVGDRKTKGLIIGKNRLRFDSNKNGKNRSKVSRKTSSISSLRWYFYGSVSLKNEFLVYASARLETRSAARVYRVTALWVSIYRKREQGFHPRRILVPGECAFRASCEIDIGDIEQFLKNRSPCSKPDAKHFLSLHSIMLDRLDKRWSRSI